MQSLCLRPWWRPQTGWFISSRNALLPVLEAAAGLVRTYSWFPDTILSLTLIPGQTMLWLIQKEALLFLVTVYVPLPAVEQTFDIEKQSLDYFQDWASWGSIYRYICINISIYLPCVCIVHLHSQNSQLLWLLLLLVLSFSLHNKFILFQ